MRQNESGFYIVNLHFSTLQTEEFLVSEESMDKIINITKQNAAGRLSKITKKRLFSNKTNEEIQSLMISKIIIKDIKNKSKNYSLGAIELVWEKK